MTRPSSPPSRSSGPPLPAIGTEGDGLAPLLDRYRAAAARRMAWEPLWRDCCDFALPMNAGQSTAAGALERLFDGTAPDAVDQLAASLLAQLTPPWSRWIGLAPGPAVTERDRAALAPALERTAGTLQAQVDRSNFAIEIHQCWLELATLGTACLLVEENDPGEASCLRFSAVPLAELALDEGPSGRLEEIWRRHEQTAVALEHRFGPGSLPPAFRKMAEAEPGRRYPVLEAVLPDGPAWRWLAILEGTGTGPALLAEGRLARSPFIAFRWMKAPGESYGRSPVMKTLPDIKTANKVVELVLKNASIAATGMWQADDDGVLNPATIRLTPGTIIPKAVGSAGLTPLAAPGRFDVSQLVLDDLRRSIRHALLVDQMGPVNAGRMTATEVLERSAEMARLLGATYGRLQSELLTPLVQRVLAILRRRGEIPDIALDGRHVDIQYRSPLAQAQAHRNVQAVLRWLDSASGLGAAAAQIVDGPAAARWLAEALGVPPALVRAAASTPAPSTTPGTTPGATPGAAPPA